MAGCPPSRFNFPRQGGPTGTLLKNVRQKHPPPAPLPCVLPAPPLCPAQVLAEELSLVSFTA